MKRVDSQSNNSEYSHDTRLKRAESYLMRLISEESNSLKASVNSDNLAQDTPLNFIPSQKLSSFLMQDAWRLENAMAKDDAFSLEEAEHKTERKCSSLKESFEKVISIDLEESPSSKDSQKIDFAMKNKMKEKKGKPKKKKNKFVLLVEEEQQPELLIESLTSFSESEINSCLCIERESKKYQYVLVMLSELQISELVKKLNLPVIMTNVYASFFCKSLFSLIPKQDQINVVNSICEAFEEIAINAYGMFCIQAMIVSFKEHSCKQLLAKLVENSFITLALVFC